MSDRKIILVTRQTRVEELLKRFNTLEQVRFYVEHLGADFSDYEREHATYQAVESFVSWLWIGPSAAKVTAVEVADAPVHGAPAGFHTA